jgi:predicted dehydrogenase
MNTKKLRFGVIGAGGIADRRTIPGILASLHGELAAVMDATMPAAQRVGSKYSVKAYDSVKALLADSAVDAVYIASPVVNHVEQALAVCEAGKPLLLEKPLALTCKEGQRIVDAFATKGLPLATGLMMRFATHIRQMRERVQAGEIGSIVSAYARFSCWYPPIEGAWRQSLSTGGGGALLDMGVHVIDLIHFITGSPIVQVAAMQERQTFPYEVEDASCLVLKLQNGALCSLQNHFNIPDEAADWRLDFFGDKGCLLGEGVLGQVDAGSLKQISLQQTGGYDSAQDGQRAQAQQIAGAYGNLYTRQIDSFCLSVLEDRPLEVPAGEALLAQAVVEAAYESGKTGRFVNVGQ